EREDDNKANSELQDNYRAHMTPNHQELERTETRAEWNLSWNIPPGPYKIYFKADSGEPLIRINSIPPGASSGSYYHHYYSSGPRLFNPSISVGNVHNDPAFADATVYKTP